MHAIWVSNRRLWPNGILTNTTVTAPMSPNDECSSGDFHKRLMESIYKVSRAFKGVSCRNLTDPDSLTAVVKETRSQLQGLQCNSDHRIKSPVIEMYIIPLTSTNNCCDWFWHGQDKCHSLLQFVPLLLDPYDRTLPYTCRFCYFLHTMVSSTPTCSHSF